MQTEPVALPLPLADRQRVMADTSLDCFNEIRKRLPKVDLLMALHADDYCRAKGYPDVTGMELANWLRRAVTHVRPRLTGALNAGWLVVSIKRKSREPNERVCHPYRLTLPRAAVERAIRQVDAEARKK